MNAIVAVIYGKTKNRKKGGMIYMKNKLFVYAVILILLAALVGDIFGLWGLTTAGCVLGGYLIGLEHKKHKKQENNSK